MSLVAQMVKNLPAVQETRVRSLGWEETLEKGKATHSSIIGIISRAPLMEGQVPKLQPAFARGLTSSQI